MPFCASQIEPNCLARKSDTENVEDPHFEDFNQVTAFTIVQAIRQLSSLTKEASEVFDNTLKSIHDFVQRTSLLEPRLRDIEQEVSKLNRKRSKVGRSSLSKQNVANSDWKFQVGLTENLFISDLRPVCVERYRARHTESAFVQLARYKNYIKSQIGNGSANGSFESLSSQLSQGSLSSGSGPKFIKNTKSKRAASLNRFSFRRKNQRQESFQASQTEKSSPVSISKFKHFPRPNSCDVLNSEDTQSTASDPNEDRFGSIHSRESSHQLVEYELRAQQFLHPASSDHALANFRPTSLVALPNNPPHNQSSSSSDLTSHEHSRSFDPNVGPPAFVGRRGLYGGAERTNTAGVYDRPLSLFEGQNLADNVNRLQSGAPLQHSDFDQSSDLVENVLDNLPVLSEEAEDEDCAALITCCDDVTSANVISCHVMIPNESSAVIGDINHKEVLVGSDSEDLLADQKPEELYSAELSSTGSKGAIRKSLDLLPSRWDPKRRLSSKDETKPFSQEARKNSSSDLTADSGTVQRTQSFITRSAKWATKKLMSTGSFTKNAAEAASDTIASSDSKETTTKLTNGNAAAMNGSVIPILLSLDLETPKKVQPDLIAAQLAQKLDGGGDTEGMKDPIDQQSRRGRRASFQCFDDSRFMSLPRVNHFSLYDYGYANLDPHSLKQALVSNDGALKVEDNQRGNQAKANGWPDAFYMNTGDNSTTNGDIAKGKEIGAGVGERSSIFNSDVTTAEDESSSIQSQASITATITSDTTTPKGAENVNLALSKDENDGTKQEDTISNNSTLIDDDEFQNEILPLDDPTTVVGPGQLNSNAHTSSSILPPASCCSAEQSQNYNVQTSLQNVDVLPTSSIEGASSSDPIMSMRQHPRLLMSQISDPSGYSGMRPVNYPDLPFGLAAQGAQIQTSFPKQDHFVRTAHTSQMQYPHLHSNRMFVNPSASSLQKPKKNKQNALESSPQFPVSSFLSPPAKTKKSKKLTWTDILWKPRGGSSNSEKDPNGTLTSGSVSQGKAKFANLNPSADKVTSRTRSASERLSFFRKKPKSEKQSDAQLFPNGVEDATCASSQCNEPLRSANNLEYIAPVASSGLERVINLPGSTPDGRSQPSYMNVDSRYQTPVANIPKNNQSFDSIESNYNTESISSSIYAPNSVSSNNSTDSETRTNNTQLSNYFNAEARIPGTEYYNGIPLAMRPTVPLDEIAAAEEKKRLSEKDGKVNNGSEPTRDQTENRTNLITNLSAEEFVERHLTDETELVSDSRNIEDWSSNDKTPENATIETSQITKTGDKDSSSGSANTSLTSASNSSLSSSSGLPKKRNKIHFNEIVSAHSVESLYDDCLTYASNAKQMEKEKEREAKVRTVISNSLAKKPIRSILRRSATSRNPDVYGKHGVTLRQSNSFDHGYGARTSYGSDCSNGSNNSNPSIPFIDEEKGSQLSIYEDAELHGGNIDPRWLAMQSSLGQATRAELDDEDLDLIDDDEDDDDDDDFDDDSGSETEEEDNDSVVYHSTPSPNRIVTC
ncbi:uncharacterized protein LOC134853832 isoform X2 [Symsagittifera roscoffensis]|uniref:uncharacterized protein LOC134853832 isoform X2 n=1 Tax=Symsagittifera roscoffensis TaxID=84072 RepID=UPI00307C2544